MTPEEFFKQYQAGSIAVIELEGGTNSKMYITKSQYIIGGMIFFWVLRQPRECQQLPPGANVPVLACQKWNKINPELPAYHSDVANIWISPYLGRNHPTKLRVKTTILDIYQKTGIILANGFICKNFLNKCHHIYYVDMDYAIDPTSPMSDLLFNQLIATRGFDEYFAIPEEDEVEIKDIIKTLFYIEQELRHLVFERAKITPRIIKMLHPFREGNYHIYLLTLDILFHFQELAVNPDLITPEIISLFMLHWDASLTKLQIEHTLDEIRQHIRNVPNPLEPPSLPGFFEHLRHRMPYTGKTSELSF